MFCIVVLVCTKRSRLLEPDLDIVKPKPVDFRVVRKV